MKTLITLIHTDNKWKVVTAIAGVIVLLAEYTGTLPAPLEQHRDWIELAAYVITGLALIHIDPKNELEK